MDDVARNARIRTRVRVVGAVVVTVAASVVPFAASANAATDVDLSTVLLNVVDSPVTDSPILVIVGVNNDGTANATNVVADVSVPTGATVVNHSTNCTASVTTVSCTYPSIAAGSNDGSRIFFSFATTGTRTVTSSARATQPDVDGNSADDLGIVVGNENADLVGMADSARVVLGTQTTFHVSPQFDNRGPTAVGEATMTGTVTGGATIVPGSFSFVGDYLDDPTNHAADDCTVTATTFSCAPVYSAGIFYAPQPFVNYDVTMPASPATIVASATLTGRADPNHANDTSTFTIALDPPHAEIFTQLVWASPALASGEPVMISGPVGNWGELPASNLVAVFAAPAGWTIAVPSETLPSGVACSIISSPHAMQCTRTTLAAGETWMVDLEVTPPAGSGTGTFSLSVTTTSAQTGIYPDSASADIPFAPGGETRAVTATPDTNLEDGNVVVFAGTGFTPGASVLYCQGASTGGAPSPADCGEKHASVVASDTGSFSVNVSVSRFLVVANRGVVDCAQPTNTCGIGALGGSNSTPIVANLAFTAKPPVADPLNARINGTITDSLGNPVPGAVVYGYRSTDSWVATLQTTTDASGNYVLEDAEPGIAYRLVFIAPTGSAAVAEWYGGPSSDGAVSRGTAVDVRLGTSQPVVTASAELAAGGVIAGTVTGLGGTPVANAIVWGYRNDDGYVGTYAAVTHPDGTYRIEGVRVGTPLRLLVAPPSGSGLAPEWFDNVGSRSSAQVVTVTQGATITANAQLGP